MVPTMRTHPAIEGHTNLSAPGAQGKAPGPGAWIHLDDVRALARARTGARTQRASGARGSAGAP